MSGLMALGLFGFSMVAGAVSSGWALAGIVALFFFEQVLQANFDFFQVRNEAANYAYSLPPIVFLGWKLFSDRQIYASYITRTWISVIVLYTWSALSLAWSPADTAGASMVRGGIPYLILFVMIGPLLIWDLRSASRFLEATLWFGVPAIVLATLSPNFVYINGRLALKIALSVDSNPLALGEFGGLLVIIGGLYSGSARSRAALIIRVLAIVLGFLISLQSGSRGQLVFCILVALVMLPVARRVQNIARLIGIVLVSTMSLAAALVIAERVFGVEVAARWTARELEAGTAGRLTNYVELLSAWTQSPAHLFLGLGVNAFSAVSGSSKEGYAHNIFVELLSEAGIPMTVLFCLVVFSGLRSGFRVWRDCSDDLEARSSIACLIGLAIYYFLIANKQGNFWGQQSLFLFLCILARLEARRGSELENMADGSWCSGDMTDQGHALTIARAEGLKLAD